MYKRIHVDNIFKLVISYQTSKKYKVVSTLTTKSLTQLLHISNYVMNRRQLFMNYKIMYNKEEGQLS